MSGEGGVEVGVASQCRGASSTTTDLLCDDCFRSFLQDCEMPPCARAALPHSTARPDNSAQFLTQWRYGSWTAVSDAMKPITKSFLKVPHWSQISRVALREYVYATMAGLTFNLHQGHPSNGPNSPLFGGLLSLTCRRNCSFPQQCVVALSLTRSKLFSGDR